MNPSEEEVVDNAADDMVMTPGGLKPRGHVHAVKPGETVRGNEDGTFSVVPQEQGKVHVKEPGMADELVLTPGGYRHKSRVHHVPKGHKVDGKQNHMRIMHPTGTVLADLGPLAVHATNRPLMPENVAHAPAIAPATVPAFGSGWISYTYWSNTTGSPVSSFASTWVVPPVPTTQSGQVIFLFNGIQNSTMIYQPVLQWGPSQAGGGSYWAVASWYADSQTGHSFYSTLVPVNVGDVLVGVMTLTGSSGGAFSYNCEFQGIPDATLPITNVQELTWCIETLEAYTITQCSDYPATDLTAITAINLETSAGTPPLVWTPVNQVTDCGQKAVVVNGSANGGEVDLYYH